ncbi:transglutaminase domain-containing protein [Ilumatobacter nonamiensis]|uniref:transglutaminase domain-containing protein n=1 Tax=Ilumatobacter nonamiensis TaxID=467093 RepID=UPI000346585D|nr:transglutaminaseTgpA domain-containing protein [Ilumatobacter nonamiensis]
MTEHAESVGRDPVDARFVADALVIAILSVAATAGLHSVYDDWSYLATAAAGAATSFAALIAARRWHLLTGEMLLLALLGFVVIGVVATGGLPTPSAIGDFFDGLTAGWADLVTTVVPAELTPARRVPPFAIAWFSMLVGAVLIRWDRIPGSPLLGPLLGLALTVLLSDDDREIAIVVGAIFIVGSLVMIAPRLDRRRALRIAAVLAAIGIAAPIIGPRLPTADANERYDLRDEIVPPWDPLSVPSPLTGLKADLAAENENNVVFDVTSDQPVTRWSRATMTSFDGVVWSVADPDAPPEDFAPVGPRLPEPPVQPTSDPEVTATVTVRDLDGPWVPMPGAGRELSIEVPGADGTASSDQPVVRENVATGTVAVPGGLPPGTVYTVTALAPPAADDDALLPAEIDVTAAEVELDVLPPQIRNLAADITEGIDHGWGQIAAIRDKFRSEGFYDKSTRTSPGHSYFRVSDFLADPDEIVGYEEQYAAAAALIARIAELPVRVTTGWEVEPDRYEGGTASVRSGDATAWIDVRVDGVGWVPVSVTPPRSREPQSDTAVASADQVATPNPPPPPQVPPDVDIINDSQDEDEEVVEEEDEEEEEEDEEVTTDAGFGAAQWAAVGVSVVLLLALLAALVIVGWKLRRRTRRRSGPAPAARIAGAWLELSDRCVEAGMSSDRQATPAEAARNYAADPRFDEAEGHELMELANGVDRAAYHSEPPSPAAADAAWVSCDAAVDGLRSHHSLPRRVRMRLDPRPLTRRDPAFDAVRVHDDDIEALR